MDAKPSFRSSEPRGATIRAAALLLGLAVPWGDVVAQTPARTQAPQRPDQPFRATVLSVDSVRLMLSAPTPTGTRELRLPPSLLRRLGTLRGRSFTAVVAERPTPAGVRTALVLRDGAAIRVVAEVIRDVEILRPAERGGIQVAVRPAQGRTLLYEDQCKTVYNVPTAFTIGGEEFLLQAFEQRTVRARDGTYTISLAESQFVVLKECAAVYEGNRWLVEYAIVRNP
jgi:hypothetical protein